MIGALIFTFAILMIGAFLLWLLSLKLEDVSIVDIAWGPSFAVVTWICLARSYPTPRHWLLAGLVTLWAVRLALHIYLRHEGEDRRYQRMRAKHGEEFRLSSLYLVFGLQAALAWLISVPLQIAALRDEHYQQDLWWLDRVGIVVFAIGFLIEAAADTHLVLWKRDPKNIGKVLDRGLWALSRHPNYFGECVLWWGLYLIAAASGWAALAVWSPVLVTYLLLRVSGVPMLDKELLGRKPAYAAYVERTSAFWPRLPKGRPAADPLALDPDEEADTAEHTKPRPASAPVRQDPPTIEISIPPAGPDDAGGFDR